MARTAQAVEIEMTITPDDADAVQAWVDMTRLLFRLKERRQARQAQDEVRAQDQLGQDCPA